MFKEIPWEESLRYNYKVRRGKGSGIVSHTRCSNYIFMAIVAPENFH
jgi:hypothetical protein